jgi:hypothetical protein
VKAGKNLDERRLPRAVLPKEAVDLSLRNIERHVVQRQRPAEALGEMM